GWAGQIYPYVKSTGVYKCPDDSTPASGLSLPVSYSDNWVTAQYTSSQLAEPAITIQLSEVQGAQVVITDPQETGSITKSPADLSDNNVYLSGSNTGACCGNPTAGGSGVQYTTGVVRISGKDGTTASNRSDKGGRHTDA